MKRGNNMLWSNLEYIPLRLLRRYLFTDRFLLRFGRLIPYYAFSQNQLDPRPLVDRYEKFFQDQGITIAGKTILEVGAGATNSTGYELSRRFPVKDIYLLEPYVEFDEKTDARLLAALERGPEMRRLAAKVHRLRDLTALEDGGLDLILSHSVLEHVTRPRVFFQGLLRVLRQDGAMLHLADFRDHFFKYPYHFLQFSKKFWNRYLNPGDLPGWRLGDHLTVLQELRLEVTILEEESDMAAFADIRPSISPDYDPEDPHCATTLAALYIVRKS